MKQNRFVNIEIMEQSEIFSQREMGISHTSFKQETEFFSLIKSGDRQKVESTIGEMLQKKIVAGKMSEDELRQRKYLAVSFITLATRSAIMGGLDEDKAYNYSDLSVREIDSMRSEEEIYSYLERFCLCITDLVSRCKTSVSYPTAIKKCIRYINQNLNSKLNLSVLSKVCSLSEDYLSALFKKSTGKTVSAYVRDKRLDESKQMLINGCSTAEAAYNLGFCSESYFIKCFKNRFEVTPKKFVKEN